MESSHDYGHMKSYGGQMWWFMPAIHSECGGRRIKFEASPSYPGKPVSRN